MIAPVLRRARECALGLSVVVTAACGGGVRSGPAVAIPAQPAPEAASRAPASPRPEERPADPPPPAPVRPAGANGPRDARAMIGEAGSLEASPHRATLLINAALLRAHPSAPAMTRVLTGFLDWGSFMPYAVVHPTRDVDWILVSGSLISGSTDENVCLARYNLSEPRADRATASLLAQLPAAKKVDLGVPGVKAFSAHVDRADRVYLRPRAGILAIVPPPEGKRTAELLRRIDEPTIARSGELFRVSYSSGPMLSVFRRLPRGLEDMRMWAEPDGAGVVIHAEGDCADPEAAKLVVGEIGRFVDRLLARPIVRLVFGETIRKARVWADGPTARLRLALSDREIEALAAAVCQHGGDGCVD